MADEGRRDEAVKMLTLAAAEFEALGATRYRIQVERDLRRLGQTIRTRARRGDRAQGGIAALHGRELEVAFLGIKTVETHVRNIFNKLGVSSRVEIARTNRSYDSGIGEGRPSLCRSWG